MSFASNDDAELACTYAALVLHDDNVAITEDKLQKIIEAAGLKVQPFWTALYAKVLAEKNLDDLITNVGGGAAPAAAAGGAAAPAAEAAKEAEPEPEEESDEDMGFGLFD